MIHPTTRRRAIEGAVCLAVATVTACALLLPCLLGKVPVDTAPLFLYPPWEEARPDGAVQSPDPVAAVAIQRYIPWYIFLQACAENGESTLWNPLEYGGVPFYALWRTRCLSPFSLPFYLFDLQTAFTLSLLLKLTAAGVCAYFAARKLALRIPFAMGMAIAFQCSPLLLLWSTWPISDVVPWVPLLIVFADRVAQGQLNAWPWGAAAMLLVLLGGAPETAIALSLAVGVFLMAEHLLAKRRIADLVRRLAVVLVTFTLALAAAAVQIVPFAEFVSQSTFATGSSQVPQAGFAQLIVTALPYFFGRPPAIYESEAPAHSFVQLSVLYAGIVPLLMVPLWLSLRKWVSPMQARRIDSLAITAAAMLFAGIMLSSATPYVPSIFELGLQDFLAAHTLLLFMVASAAAQEWLTLAPEECKETIPRLLAYWGALAALGVMLIMTSYGADRPAAPALLAQLLTSGIWVVGVLALLTWTLLRPSAKVMTVALTVLVASDLLLTIRPARAFATAESVFPSTTFISLLKTGNTRVSGKSALGAWPLAGNLVPQFSGSSGVQLARYAAFINKIEEDPLLLRRGGSPLLLLSKSDIQGAFKSARPILRLDRVMQSGAVLFTDLETQSRLRLAYEARPANQFDAALLDPNLPPLVEIKTAQAFTATAGPPGTVTLNGAESNTRIAARVQHSHAGVLVLADAWYPGWQAYIDGQPTEVFPVDGIFRGVLVSEGAHDVEFRYEPRTQRPAIAVSTAALLLIALGIARKRLQRQ